MAFWLWPDRIIRKRESRRLRDEHNKLAQAHADMRAALSEIAELLDGVSSDPGSYVNEALSKARDTLAKS